MKYASSIQSVLRHAPIGELLPAGFAAFLSSLSSILLLATSAYLIASAALHPPLYTLALAITLVRACGLGRAVFRYLDRWLSHRAVFHAQERLRLRLYEKASALLPLKEGGARQGEFLHGLAVGCDALRDFYLKSLTPPTITLLLCLTGTLLLFPVAGPIALLLPLLWLLHLLLPALLDRADNDALNRADIQYRALLLDLQEGRHDLQSSGSISIAEKKLQKAAQNLAHCQKEQARRRNLVDTLLLLLNDMVLVIFLFLLSLSTLSGTMTGIDLAVFLLVLQTILAELAPLSEALRMGREAMHAAQDVLHIPDPASHSQAPATDDLSQTEREPAPLLSVQDLCFSYIPGLPVLKNVSFTLCPGEKLAIIGESGCGKTTLACLLMGLWPPESGHIRLKGPDCSRHSPDGIRKAFAPCLQGEYVFQSSVRENFLRLHTGIEEESIWEALSAAQLKEDILSLPQKLDTPLGENGSRLSGGQRQRLLIALALASAAPILLLDEPTAGLDKKTAHALMEGILSHHEERALVIITHDMVLAERMDKIYRL